MRIGVLSDIHGNYTALVAVLRDLERRGVDRVVNLGDVAFRGPQPQECVQAVREMGAPVLLGNTEVWLTDADLSLPEPLPEVRAWTRERLTAADLQWLGSLPADLRLQVGGQRLLFVHGSPRSNMDFLFPFSPEVDLQAALEGCTADVMVCGHTHWAFSRRVGGVHLVGTGSIGLPFDGDPRAAYVIMDVAADAMALTHVRVNYETGRTVAVAQEQAFPDLSFLSRVVTTGSR